MFHTNTGQQNHDLTVFSFNEHLYKGSASQPVCREIVESIACDSSKENVSVSYVSVISFGVLREQRYSELPLIENRTSRYVLL